MDLEAVAQKYKDIVTIAFTRAELERMQFSLLIDKEDPETDTWWNDDSKSAHEKIRQILALAD